MAEQAEPGDVGDGARLEGTQNLRGLAVEHPHPAHGFGELGVAGQPALEPVQHETGAERLREEDHVTRCSRAQPDRVWMRGADHREPVLRLVVADRVPSSQQRPSGAHRLVRPLEDLAQNARGQLLGKGRDREGHQRRSAHGEDVVERVGRGDGAEVARIVHDGRKKSTVKMSARSSSSL